MHYKDQPFFLNAVASLQTNLEPLSLLKRLKSIEHQQGRSPGGSSDYVRYGPRHIDLDILHIQGSIVDIRGSDDDEYWLRVPHERLKERRFVLEPLCDIDDGLVVHFPASWDSGDGEEVQVGELLRRLTEKKEGEEIRRVTPLRGEKRRLLYWDCGKETRGNAKCMGIVNATPDSFSDGGEMETVEAVLKRVREFVDAGFEMVDVGGQSTAPGAVDVSEEEELRRVVPVIEAIREQWPNLIISVDTFRAEVARQAIDAGAQIVNDVSAGTGDEKEGAMHEVVRDSQTVWIMMHRRGDASTMDRFIDYSKKGVVEEVAGELKANMDKAVIQQGKEKNFIPRWMMWADAGLGFAKTAEQSLTLMRELKSFKEKVGNYPILVGPSRKRFVGKATGQDNAKDRDWGSAGAAAIGVVGGAEIVRVHNPNVMDSIKLANAVLRGTV